MAAHVHAQFLFAFQTTGLFCFSLGAFGLSWPMLLFSAVTIFIAFVGPREPRIYLGSNDKPMSPLPRSLLVIFIINATVNFTGNWFVFGTILPGLLVALGGIIEGTLAETSFNQLWHLFAFLMLDYGLFLHMFLYLGLL